ncbi:hypothetical protein [Ruminococcus sp.]
MKIIKNIFCNHCKELDYYKKSLYDMEELSINMIERTKTLDLLMKFNESNEQIVFLKDLSGTNYTEFFVVTREEEYNHLNCLKEVNFYGYTLNPKYDLAERVIQMYTETILDYNKIADKVIIDSVNIIDIITISKNQGFGSCVMNCFLQYMKSINVKKVFGYLSPVDEYDENNKSLRNHFYEKFNFKFKSKGRIELEIE